MECNPCAHDQGWRAIHGKRTEELLRQPQALWFGIPQSRTLLQASKQPGKRTETKVGIGFAGAVQGPRLPQGSAADLKSLELPPMLENSNYSNEETPAANFKTSLNGHQVGLKSVKLVSDPAVLSHRRASHVHAAENPCRWGVDVFNYQLPEPRKLRGFGTEENLGSTLYPAESDCIKVAQGKRRNKVDGDNLDAGMIPSVGPESCAKRCSGQWHMRSLQIDMTPQNTATTKTGRRQHPEWHRESLHRGSLLPL
ncbi:hypothetical protein, conserved [Eimeria brunetti]|uniref:Uncharacterized protein n=1 Tax=Eimeria brunetti TaxID=51314 RepID=U6LYE2_9EIME|nr:hypothetical protein, conserved [Eimeria brunetti]